MPGIIEVLIDKNLLKILRLLNKHQETLFHLNKISAETGVPVSSVFRIVPKLAEKGVLEKVVVGKLKLYKLTQRKLLERFL